MAPLSVQKQLLLTDRQLVALGSTLKATFGSVLHLAAPSLSALLVCSGNCRWVLTHAQGADCCSAAAAGALHALLACAVTRPAVCKIMAGWSSQPLVTALTAQQVGAGRCPI